MGRGGFVCVGAFCRDWNTFRRAVLMCKETVPLAGRQARDAICPAGGNLHGTGEEGINGDRVHYYFHLSPFLNCARMTWQDQKLLAIPNCPV